MASDEQMFQFVARAVQEWIAAVGAKTACIEYPQELVALGIVVGGAARPDDERIKERTNSWR
jgi:hypothetical protein